MEAMDEISGYISETTSSSVSSPLPAHTGSQQSGSAGRAEEKRQRERESEGEEETKRPTTSSSSSSSSSSAHRPQRAREGERESHTGTHAQRETQKEKEKEVDTMQYKFIPMRLSTEERRMLNVLVSALEVCEYTDVVDVTFSHTRKNKYARIVESLADFLSICSGLMLANNLNKGEQLVAGKALHENEEFFRDIFEIGRRYKIMNPSKMRSTYGKMMYMLMDTESYQVKQELQFSLVKPVLSVARFMYERDAFDALTDPLWLEAAGCAFETTGKESKREVTMRAQRKKQALATLCEKYASEELTAADIERVVESISDNASYFAFNVTPVKKMLSLLEDSFDPEHPSGPFSLQLNGTSNKRGSNSSFFSSTSSFLFQGYSASYMGRGACLSHSHATQYRFVRQSLALWKVIMRRMPKLWFLADLDMTNESYRLVDTGQGYQRLQSCPRVRKEMSSILSVVQSKVGQWVGLSVVHLGDRDVPNALVFIDKYTQVSRILSPIVQCVEQLPSLVEDEAFHAYVQAEWGSIEGLRMQLLCDFFKHGFDGSGDDGGSCIDGRLTSAWNWCSQLHKKPFHSVFLFAGFQGFDGDFKDAL